MKMYEGIKSIRKGFNDSIEKIPYVGKILTQDVDKGLKTATAISLAFLATYLPGCNSYETSCNSYETKTTEIPRLNFQEDIDRLLKMKRELGSIREFADRSVTFADGALQAQRKSYDLGNETLEIDHQVIDNLVGDK